MKIAIVSFGHVDVILPLAKYLSKHIDIDLYLSFALNKRSESILNFKHINVPEGLLGSEFTKKILGYRTLNYINGKLNIYFFIYHNLKIRSLRNWRLSFLFSRILNKYNIIHFNGQDAVLPQLNLFLTGKKKVFTVHDFVGHSGMKSRFAEFTNKMLAMFRYPVIVQNKKTYEFINKTYSNKYIEYIPFGPLEIYKCFRKKDDVVKTKDNSILFWGRFSEYKGIDNLIKAAKLASKKLKGLNVIIAGSGDFEFEKYNIINDKTFHIVNRYLSNDELVKLIMETCVVVCPYTDATQSGVVMTAYAFNKPVIATNVGGLAEVVEDRKTGLLVPPENVEKLSMAIVEILSNNDKLNEYINNIAEIKISGEYSWDKIAEKTLDFYNRI